MFYLDIKIVKYSWRKDYIEYQVKRRKINKISYLIFSCTPSHISEIFRDAQPQKVSEFSLSTCFDDGSLIENKWKYCIQGLLICHPFRMFLISHLSCLFLNRKLLKMFNNERLTDLIMLVLDGAGWQWRCVGCNSWLLNARWGADGCWRMLGDPSHGGL